MIPEMQQKEHFNKLATLYEAHYGDHCSQQYRLKFVYEPMFDGIELSGMKVLEAMSGSGETTAYLLARGSQVTGLDISTQGINLFRKRWPKCDSICRSILDSGLPDNSYDCIVSIGGLHHLQPNAGKAVSEIHRILKKGGRFCFSDPHTGSMPDMVRRFWYRHDHFFADNEASVHLEALKEEFATRFRFIKEVYMGNIAYLLVFNSMIFRIPLRLKPLFTPPLIVLESIINRFQGRLSSCFAVSQWQKK